MMTENNKRKKEIEKYLLHQIEECFRCTCRLIQRDVDSCGRQIWKELKEKIDEVLQLTSDLQKQNKKGSIQYLVFNFLRNSTSRDKLSLYIQTLDDSFYLDEQETAVYYYPSFLQDKYVDDLSCLYRKAEEKFIRLQSYELTSIKELYTEFYFSIVFSLIQQLSELIIKEVIMSNIQVTDSFKIIYGEYMDQAIVIFSKEK